MWAATWQRGGHWITLGMWLVMSSFGGRAFAGLSTTGKWTYIPNAIDGARWDSIAAGKLISGGGTHLALLHGNGDTTWVIHWHEEHRAPRLWLFKPDSSNTTWGFPVANDLTDAFCAGQSTLADGRLLVVGGTIHGVIGETHVNAFDPKRWYEAADPQQAKLGNGWTRQDTTAFGRWYPTCTTLGDGKVLATSGTQYAYMGLTGGGNGSSTLYNDLRTLPLTRYPEWNTDPTTVHPAARQGHSLNFNWDTGRIVMFGGQGSGGTLIPTDSVMLAWRQDTHTGIGWSWESMYTAADPRPGRGYPRPRWRHAAAMLGDTLVIFGGLASDNTVMRDVWMLDFGLAPPRWTQIDPDSGSSEPYILPGPRYGHVATMDRGIDSETIPVPKMLIFGGKRDASNLAAADAWSLLIRRNGDTGSVNWKWKKEAAGGSGAPSIRDGAAAVMDGLSNDRHNAMTKRNLLLFGGDGFFGPLNDLWALTRGNTSAADSTFSWRLLAPSGPPGRWQHAMVYDEQWDALRVFGGNLNHWNAAASPANDLWSISLVGLNALAAGAPLDSTWKQEWMGNSAPEARIGHAAVYDARIVFAHIPERFDPSVGLLGRWSKLTTAPKRISDYPHMFLLRNGKVFYAGNGPESDASSKTSYVLDTNDTWIASSQSGFNGGSSVLVGTQTQDKVLKYGGRFVATKEQKTATINTVTGSTAWSTFAENLGHTNRRFHNLTWLPTGKLLLTGGRDQGHQPVKATNMWDPATGQWLLQETLLAPDLEERQYHSAALLLPDGRVLAASGLVPGVFAPASATIFAPPYLYNGPRPVIQSSPSQVSHGEVFEITTDPAPIASICLIRPGAVTHGFNQGQMYVPLSSSGTPPNLQVVAPASTNVAPPGEYLLFVVNGAGVPSIAKWVHLPDQEAPGQVTDLEMLVGPSSVNAYWTPAGDDGYTGQATAYELRYHTQWITESNWNQAAIGATGPGGGGNVLVFGLDACRLYYFAVKTRDNANNWSPLGNVASCMTWCGAGPGAAALDDAGSLSVTDAGQKLICAVGRGDGGGVTAFAQVGGGSTNLDSIRVVYVDHSPDTVAWARSGQSAIVLGARSPAHRVVTEAGTDARGQFKDAGGSGYLTKPGEILAVRLSSSETSEVGGLVLETGPWDGGNTAFGTGVRVEALTSAGVWIQRGRFLPRTGGGSIIVEGLAGDSLRLTFDGPYRLCSVGKVVATGLTSGSGQLPLLSGQHSRLGTVELGDSGPVATTLGSGERFQVTFGSLPVEDHRVRDRFVEYIASNGVSEEADGSVAELGLPGEFALRQNRPNPFSARTAIHFDLPVATRVELDMFDIQGRRIRGLVNVTYPAGYHAVDWDKRTTDGGMVRPGVYLYRMRAGTFQARKKMVVLP